jgi:hypothetical protein
MVNVIDLTCHRFRGTRSLKGDHAQMSRALGRDRRPCEIDIAHCEGSFVSPPVLDSVETSMTVSERDSRIGV